ncbi:hypothetical protein J7400_21000 [Shimia sp. R9_2]|uniref:hypothetical protein n=1 Tax=Shimia sp. R9_2 TaxID=2821112 RepID=UPI001ADB2F3C|nr:hypothetical protein [Shimia sp. R9_2]MBO9399161.1 hypothetical protein [Shimia sp. R9_2]
MRDNYATYISFTLGTLLSAIPHIVGAFDAEHPLAQSDLWAVFAIAGMICAASPTVFRTFREQKELRTKIDVLLFQNLEESYLGFAKVADKQIFRDLRNARKVQNTFVGLRAGSEQEDTRIISTYKGWLRRADTELWEDLISIREYYSGRFRKIKVRNYHLGRHRIFVLKDGVTPLNFIIQRDMADGSADVVYFGWIPNLEREKTRIFKSTDPNLIQMFSDYFEALKAQSWNTELDSSDEHYNGFALDHSTDEIGKLDNVISSLVNKQGKWMTVAFEMGEEGNFEQIQSVSFFELKFVGPKVQLHPEIYDSEGNKLPGFHTKEPSFYKNNVYFNYHVRDNNAHGICHYRFSRHVSLGPILTGVFCDSVSNKRHALVGFNTQFNSRAVRNLSKEDLKQHIDVAKEFFKDRSAQDIKHLIEV